MCAGDRSVPSAAAAADQECDHHAGRGVPGHNSRRLGAAARRPQGNCGGGGGHFHPVGRPLSRSGHRPPQRQSQTPRIRRARQGPPQVRPSTKFH